MRKEECGQPTSERGLTECQQEGIEHGIEDERKRTYHDHNLKCDNKRKKNCAVCRDSFEEIGFQSLSHFEYLHDETVYCAIDVAKENLPSDFVVRAFLATLESQPMRFAL